MKTIHLSEIFPTKTRLRLAAVWAIVVLFLVFGPGLFDEALTGTIALGTFLLLLFTIIGAAFGVVKEADALAHKLGEPYGTLILTLSIVSIEVILIAAVLLGPGDNPTIGKDSIFSVMMIIMNLVMGLCILLGGFKFGEQEYNAQGTLSYMAMIILLGGIGLLLPNFIQGAGGGAFTPTQAIVLAGLVIVLYGFFLLLQMKNYKHLYQQPKAGNMGILFSRRQALEEQATATKTTPINKKEIGVRTLILLGMIVPIVLLSHNMAAVVDYGIKATSLPPLLGGVLIAIIVFTPESMTAIKAALNNEFQRAINLCHGAFVSTVGLTIPAVLIVGLVTGKTVLFGMTATETILFIITLLLSLMTFIGKRTTPIMGMMHLVLFVVFILLIFNP
ncbi:calcium:proton antiporter [Myroides odoratus]